MSLVGPRQQTPKFTCLVKAESFVMLLYFLVQEVIIETRTVICQSSLNREIEEFFVVAFSQLKVYESVLASKLRN